MLSVVLRFEDEGVRMGALSYAKILKWNVFGLYEFQMMMGTRWTWILIRELERRLTLSVICDTFPRLPAATS